jgi:hypothetical protein
MVAAWTNSDWFRTTIDSSTRREFSQSKETYIFTTIRRSRTNSSAAFSCSGRDICGISERPRILELDGSNRPHSLTGPALAFRDGWEVHAIHGVTLPGYAIRKPENITVEAIVLETNVERRRVLIDLFGVQRFLDDSGARAISRDASGVLYRKTLRGAEPVTMVHVLNSTPEPDGEMSRDQAIEAFGDAATAAIGAPTDARFKSYFLDVPPRIKTAHDAVAWTFGMKGKDYRPTIQT